MKRLKTESIPSQQKWRMRMREIAKERKKTAYIAASNKTLAEPRNSQYLKLINLLPFYEVAVDVR